MLIKEVEGFKLAKLQVTWDMESPRWLALGMGNDGEWVSGGNK